MSNQYLEKSKKAWTCASNFSADKESVYPDHKIVQEFDLIHNKSVYEYGCGGGSDVMSYLRRNNIVTATDIVPENIEMTKKRVSELLPDKVNNSFLLLLENSYPLPFKDNSFDIINSHGVLHHIKEAQKVMSELYRVCKPSGFIYFMVYTDILWQYHFPAMEKLMKLHGIDKYEAFCWMTDGMGTPYARCYSAVEACEFAEDAGFIVIDFNYWLNDWFLTIKGQK